MGAGPNSLTLGYAAGSPGRSHRPVASRSGSYRSIPRIYLQLALTAALKSTLSHRSIDTRAFVLWGSAQRPNLPGECRSRLDTVATETGDVLGPRLWFSDRTSRVASSFAVADGNRMLYASWSLL